VRTLAFLAAVFLLLATGFRRSRIVFDGFVRLEKKEI
jgi:hypothetical protein